MVFENLMLNITWIIRAFSHTTYLARFRELSPRLSILRSPPNFFRQNGANVFGNSSERFPTALLCGGTGLTWSLTLWSILRCCTYLLVPLSYYCSATLSQICVSASRRINHLSSTPIILYRHDISECILLLRYFDRLCRNLRVRSLYVTARIIASAATPCVRWSIAFPIVLQESPVENSVFPTQHDPPARRLLRSEELNKFVLF